jgi:hypothetical protein
VGIQSLVVVVGIAIALTLGILSAVWFRDTSGTGWLAVSVLPAMLALLRLTERNISRGIWDYTAPYPYAPLRTKDPVEVSVKPT